MASFQKILLQTNLQMEWVDITRQVEEAIRSGADDHSSSAVLVYCPHTTAGVAVNEGWDPDVAGDLERALKALVPQLRYRHQEGNSPAHLLSVLTGNSIVLPLNEDGRLRLGRWQKVFFCEYDGPRQREIWLQLLS